MEKACEIVIPSPSPVILNEVKNLISSLRVNSAKNLVFSSKDCYVAPLFALRVVDNDNFKRIAQFNFNDSG